MILVVLKLVMNWLKNVENCQKLEKRQRAKNCLNQEIWKAENWLSPKNRQKVGIHLILMLKIAGQAF